MTTNFGVKKDQIEIYRSKRSKYIDQVIYIGESIRAIKVLIWNSHFRKQN